MRERPPLLSLQLPDAEFVVCDVETTGLSPERNRMTEIALARVAEGRVTERYSTLINPRQFVPPFITDLTGISNDMVYEAPDAELILPEAVRFIGSSVFVAHNARFDRSFVDAALARAGMQRLENPSLCTARLARRLTPQLAKKSLGSLARHLGIRNPRAHRAAGDAETTAGILLHFLEILAEEYDLCTLGDLLSFQHRPVYRIASTPKNFKALAPQIEGLPHGPGVYSFHDRKGAVIYVGKARDLRERVQSYFRFNTGHTEKTMQLARAARSVTWTSTETELSALLLEAHSIREKQPRFNSMLKNMRAYPFIRIDAADEYPVIGWCYEIEDDGAEYFGPFSSRFAVERALETIDRLFLLRECGGRIRPADGAAPCLYHEIKRCGAPCAKLQSRDEYLEEVDRVRQFLNGRYDEVLECLRSRMDAKAAALEFEEAAGLRDRIQSLERLVRQQSAMTRSVREQNLVLVTPARRTFVEVHCIKEGMLARQALIDQKSPDRRALRSLLSGVFGIRQAELFQGRREDINDMRIIATWRLTRHDESEVVEVDGFDDAGKLFDAVLNAVRSAGGRRSDAAGPAE